MKTFIQRNFLIKFLSISLAFSVVPFRICDLKAEDETDSVVLGKIYQTGDKDNYNYSEKDTFNAVDDSNTYGKFTVNGKIANISTIDDLPLYEVEEGNLVFAYNYGDTLLNADVDDFHVVDDNAKEIDDIGLNDEVGKGTIVVQASNDRINWITEYEVNNAFEEVPIQTVPIYTTSDIQLINGCYYRVIVAYKIGIRTEESNFLFFNTDKYNYQDIVEVYEFYAINKDNTVLYEDTERYNLGSKLKVSENGYSSAETVVKDDLHYGWDLGHFFVSGYTDEVDNEKITFLKNADDVVTLWFRLNQDINQLNGSEDLHITDDSDAYDEHFETPRLDFGMGTLIIRYTDHNNVKSEPQIYTDYLVANASVDADTRVQLFEEGDYEVALDYQITEDGIFGKVEHYRIYFEFAVRNGNCMIFPFDLSTGNELSNSSLTENGFKLDLAKSRYLNVNVQREVLTENGDQLVEDIRFNGPAKDGEEYTDEGIYTVTVTNQYTGQFTVKKIYVGSNPVLKAYITTGLSIPEINDLISNGASIDNEGNITVLTTSDDVESVTPESSADSNGTSDPIKNVVSTLVENDQNDKSVNSVLVPLMIVGVILVAVFVGMYLWRLNRNRYVAAIKPKSLDNEQDHDLTEDTEALGVNNDEKDS